MNHLLHPSCPWKGHSVKIECILWKRTIIVFPLKRRMWQERPTSRPDPKGVKTKSSPLGKVDVPVSEALRFADYMFIKAAIEVENGKRR